MEFENAVHGPFRTFFELFLCFAIIGSYIPQAVTIIRYGTYGISSWTVLITTLFATTQAAAYLHPLIVHEPDVFMEVQSGSLKGFRAFSALLGHVQVSLQCLCTIVISILYISYRTPISPVEHQHLTGITAHPISSRALKAIIATYSITTLLLAGYIRFVTKSIQEGVDDRLTSEWFFWLIAVFSLGTFWAYFLVLLTLVQYLPQILTTAALQSRYSISLVSLGLQILTFVVLGICQGLRLRADRTPSENWISFYLAGAFVWMNYLVAALGQIALFIVCLYVDRNELGGKEQQLRL